MKKYIFIDERMRDIEKDYFIRNGYTLIEIPKSKEVYNEISSHVDIFCSKINNKLFLEPTLYSYILKNGYKIENSIEGNIKVKSEYPYDIAYNVCQIGGNVIHNFNYTDSKLLEYINEKNLNKINIKQGYSNCSIAVIDENSAIVTDKKIANILNNNNIEVLCLEEELDIKLLNEDGTFSKMKGFIGGCITRLENKIVIFGDIDRFKQSKMIKEFINKRGLEIIDFKGYHIIDYGSLVDIT